MTLSFPGEFQPPASFWCWAAVSSAVAHYFNPSTAHTQCSIASAQVSQPCCAIGPTGNCNVYSQLQVALAHVGHLNPPTGPPPLWSQVIQEIRNNQRPVCARIAWNGGGAHFVTIYGFDVDPVLGRRYWIFDPETGVNVITEQDFLNSYPGNGFCTDCYFLI
jgi:hypothetical protein